MENNKHNEAYNTYQKDLAEIESFLDMLDMQFEFISSDFKSANVKDDWELIFNTNEIYVYHNTEENIYRLINKHYINSLFNI